MVLFVVMHALFDDGIVVPKKGCLIWFQLNLKRVFKEKIIFFAMISFDDCYCTISSPIVLLSVEWTIISVLFWSYQCLLGFSFSLRKINFEICFFLHNFLMDTVKLSEVLTSFPYYR